MRTFWNTRTFKRGDVVEYRNPIPNFPSNGSIAIVVECPNFVYVRWVAVSGEAKNLTVYVPALFKKIGHIELPVE